MVELSQAIALVILLVQNVIYADEEGLTLSCLHHKPCKMAFATNNPMTLKCVDRPENAPVYWQYLDIYDRNAQPVTFTQSNGDFGNLTSKLLRLKLGSQLMDGDLKIKSPKVEDTGIYTCKTGEMIISYYEIDFQNASDIHISHVSLGQKVQNSTMVDLGDKGIAQMVTVWSEWQPCDRCGVLGEQKKVGFCYVKISKYSETAQEAVPCGLLRATFTQLPPTHRPELRIQLCNVSCEKLHSLPEDPNRVPILVLDHFRIHLHSDASFKCPTSSIYRPVYWEHENISITRLQMLLQNVPYRLDKETGGGTLVIQSLNESDAGLYKCYVDNKLTGKFQVQFQSIRYSMKHLYSLSETMIIGIAIFLIFLMMLSIFQACMKTTAVVFHKV